MKSYKILVLLKKITINLRFQTHNLLAEKFLISTVIILKKFQMRL